VLEALLDSHSKEAESGVQDSPIHAAQLERLQFSPIVIQPGDALYIEYRGRDFTVNADFASGETTAFDSSPQGSYEQWRKGILPLDIFRAALQQRLIRLRATAKNPKQVLFRNIKIIRSGRPVFEFARLASYGNPRVKKTVERQLPCVGFDDVPANGTSTAVNYSLPNPGPVSNISGGLVQPMLPPFPMLLQSTTSTDVNHYKFTGKEWDGESGLYNYGARYYSPGLGRYLSPDWAAKPIAVPYANFGNPQSLNLYSYGKNNPITFRDADGHTPDILVIENGPTEGNPIGHTAVAVTGQGVLSFGNSTPLGSSTTAYLTEQASRRDTTVYVIKTTPEQDKAAVNAALQQDKKGTVNIYPDNCSTRSNAVLDAAGIPQAQGPVNPAGPMVMPGPDPAIPGAAGQRATQMQENKLLPPGTVQTIQIPKGSTVPDSLNQFNPGPNQNPQLPKPENKNPAVDKKKDSST
jgi:RHS repeat-associated protein